ncbi:MULTISPECIES: molecular chaperone [unclassified Halomonas]|uniref:fimbrial biogenesis chaperone n=1 Tax=unclassified Halomonas TaxID=2609666 RepID=UPI0020A17E36|nr:MULTISPECIES: molecular chaperone [unclassified Halomonas]MCP1314374.1 molecular chaperone [Halomonas sp. 707D7]MCP1326274.1 molecular chaperone [Halomonas sp. 707D4]
MDIANARHSRTANGHPTLGTWLARYLALFLWLLAPASQANSLLIWPLYPEIPHDESATALWLENQGDAALVMQLRIFAWEQRGGEEQFLPQQAIVGSPPMIQIAPGERQMVRLIRQDAVSPARENAFRVIIDEIPGAAIAGAVEGANAGVRFQMRYSLPLFVYGQGAAPLDPVALASSPHYPGLGWHTYTDGGRRMLEITNRGDHHVRLNRVAFASASRPVAEGLLGYVLAGSTRRWPLDPGADAPSELSAQVGSREYVIAPH